MRGASMDGWRMRGGWRVAREWGLGRKDRHAPPRLREAPLVLTPHTIIYMGAKSFTEENRESATCGPYISLCGRGLC